jgi:DNA repair exonuclease SbcCD ATPase subunit
LRLRAKTAEEQRKALQQQAATTPNQAAAIERLQGEIGLLQEKVSAKDVENKSLSEKLRAVTEELNSVSKRNAQITSDASSLRDANANLRIDLESLSQQLQESTAQHSSLSSAHESLADDIATLKSEKQKLADQLSRALSGTPMKRASDHLDSSIAFGSPGSALNDSVASVGKSRARLRVLMDNQLDLNQSELEYYETQVNEIASRLEEAVEERDVLKRKMDERVAELEEVIRNLRTVADSKDDNLQYYMDMVKQMEQQGANTAAIALNVKQGASEDSVSLREMTVKLEALQRDYDSLYATSQGQEQYISELQVELDGRTDDNNHYLDTLQQYEEQLQSKSESIDALKHELQQQQQRGERSERARPPPLDASIVAPATGADLSLTHMLGFGAGGSDAGDSDEEEVRSHSKHHRRNESEAEDYFERPDLRSAQHTPQSVNSVQKGGEFSFSIADGSVSHSLSDLQQKLAKRDQQVFNPMFVQLFDCCFTNVWFALLSRFVSRYLSCKPYRIHYRNKKLRTIHYGSKKRV